jgi:hypothetical protein
MYLLLTTNPSVALVSGTGQCVVGARHIYERIGVWTPRFIRAGTKRYRDFKVWATGTYYCSLELKKYRAIFRNGLLYATY